MESERAHRIMRLAIAETEIPSVKAFLAAQTIDLIERVLTDPGIIARAAELRMPEPEVDRAIALKFTLMALEACL